MILFHIDFIRIYVIPFDLRVKFTDSSFFLYCFLRKNLIYWACSKDYPSLLQSSPSNHHKQLPFKKRHPFPRRVLFLVSGSFFYFSATA